MAARDILKALAAAVIDALLRSGNHQGSTRPPRTKQPRAGKQPRLRAQRQSNTSSVDAPEAEGSPGQFGDGATRDLTPRDISQLSPSYDPSPDGDPDPGEIVWTWVPYAEHDGRGKDRPVLIIARTHDGATAGCYLSTKQHRGFISIGAGPWDSQGRESFLSPERMLRVTEVGMRREGHVLDRAGFTRAIAGLSKVHSLRDPR